jgi:uncharacterized protein RhaS with RHS repeats
VTYEYDANDNLSPITDPDGQTRRFEYISWIDRLKAPIPSVKATLMSYDNLGRLISITGPDGLLSDTDMTPKAGPTNFPSAVRPGNPL